MRKSLTDPNRIVLVRRTSPRATIIVELELADSADYYRIVSAYPQDKKRLGPLILRRD